MALLPIWSRKTETSEEMDYGEIKALKTVMDIFKVLRSVNNVQSAAWFDQVQRLSGKPE